MFDALKEAKTLEELKSAFRSLAKKLHPDVGGHEEEFKKLNALYDSLLEGMAFGRSEEDAIDVELEKKASLLAHLQGLIIEVVGSWIWVSGTTWEFKAELKEQGFKFSKKRRMWYFHREGGKRRRASALGFEDLKIKYGSRSIHSGTAVLGM